MSVNADVVAYALSTDEMNHSENQRTIGQGEIVFTPEIEREWQALRETIQQEYRQERRQALLKAVSVLAGAVCAGWVAFIGLGSVLN